MKLRRRAAIAAIFTFSLVTAARADTATPCEREIAGAAQHYNIPLAVFYAVGLTETGRGGALQPYAMNIDGRPAFSPDLATAIARFEQARKQGARMIDIGCMQINHHYHASKFASLQEMFDPAKNVTYAARLLRELKEREKTWTMAVARYNAGPDNNPAQKLYVCSVIRNMVASGFGSWTPAAQQFCR
jgi:soluble lytic murein transglycosylase-like protein